MWIEILNLFESSTKMFSGVQLSPKAHFLYRAASQSLSLTVEEAHFRPLFPYLAAFQFHRLNPFGSVFEFRQASCTVARNNGAGMQRSRTQSGGTDRGH